MIQPPAILLDVDWAPDFVVSSVAQMLIEQQVHATWFLTHASPVNVLLREHADLFELGIHPNFAPGSTHGDSVAAVMRHSLDLVPEARCMRTHRLIDSAPLLAQVLEDFPQIERDATLYLPHMAGIYPLDFYWKGRRLLRIPFCWEDNLEMERPEPCWEMDGLDWDTGLKVMAFHPIHIFLNSAHIGSYETLKAAVPDLAQADEAKLAELVYDGSGTRDMLQSVIESYAGAPRGLRLSDIVIED